MSPAMLVALPRGVAPGSEHEDGILVTGLDSPGGGGHAHQAPIDTVGVHFFIQVPLSVWPSWFVNTKKSLLGQYNWVDSLSMSSSLNMAHRLFPVIPMSSMIG